MSIKSELKFVSRDILFVIRLLIGFVLVVVGLVGLIFPIFPDWILIVIGLLFFDANGKIARHLVSLLPKRFQHEARAFALKVESKIDKVLGKWR